MRLNFRSGGVDLTPNGDTAMIRPSHAPPAFPVAPTHAGHPAGQDAAGSYTATKPPVAWIAYAMRISLLCSSMWLRVQPSVPVQSLFHPGCCMRATWSEIVKFGPATYLQVPAVHMDACWTDDPVCVVVRVPELVG